MTRSTESLNCEPNSQETSIFKQTGELSEMIRGILYVAFAPLVLGASRSHGRPVTPQAGAHCRTGQCLERGQGADHFAKLVRRTQQGRYQYPGLSIQPAWQPARPGGRPWPWHSGHDPDRHGRHGQLVPEMAVLTCPSFFRDVNHAYKALDTVGMDLAKKRRKQQGMITLAIWENGVRHT